MIMPLLKFILHKDFFGPENSLRVIETEENEPRRMITSAADYSDFSPEHDRKNLEEIVKRWNAHDDLVETLLAFYIVFKSGAKNGLRSSPELCKHYENIAEDALRNVRAL